MPFARIECCSRTIAQFQAASKPVTRLSSSSVAMSRAPSLCLIAVLSTCSVCCVCVSPSMCVVCRPLACVRLCPLSVTAPRHSRKRSHPQQRTSTHKRHTQTTQQQKQAQAERRGEEEGRERETERRGRGESKEGGAHKRAFTCAALRRCNHSDTTSVTSSSVRTYAYLLARCLSFPCSCRPVCVLPLSSALCALPPLFPLPTALPPRRSRSFAASRPLPLQLIGPSPTRA